MTVYFRIYKRPNLVVLAVHRKLWVEISEYFLFKLKKDCACLFVPHVRSVLINTAYSGFGVCFFLKAANNQRFNYHFCIVAVVITFCWTSCNTDRIALKTISTVKEFTNVTASVYRQNKFATWMIIDVLCYV